MIASHIPSFLQPGDKIGLTCTARSFSKSELESTIERIENWGFEAVMSSSIDQFHHQFGGEDQLRARSFQDLLDDDEIKAIWICRGGYGTIRIMDLINFEYFKENPKWILGYSDVTVLHSYLASKTTIPSVHCMMPSEMDKNTEESIDSIYHILSGKALEYRIESTDNYIEASVKGRLIGGNLSILYSLLGTKFDADTENCILFIEDIDEYLYHIDRMFYALKHSGKLGNIKALIVGGMTDMNDHDIPFGEHAMEIIRSHMELLRIPTFFNLPFGHIKNNLAILLNHECQIIAKNGVLTFSQKL